MRIVTGSLINSNLSLRTNSIGNSFCSNDFDPTKFCPRKHQPKGSHLTSLLHSYLSSPSEQDDALLSSSLQSNLNTCNIMQIFSDVKEIGNLEEKVDFVAVLAFNAIIREYRRLSELGQRSTLASVGSLVYSY